MKKNSISVFYDTCIFKLQRIGGISIVFGELIKKIKINPEVELSFVGSDNINNNLIFPNIKEGIPFLKEINICKALLPFSPLMVKLPKGAIFHSTYNRYSFQKNIVRVITIHDLGYEKNIMRTGFKRKVHLFFKKIAIKNADVVICVSKNTEKDLYSFYGDILKNKVVEVVYNGIDQFFFQNKKDNKPITNSILYVGGRQAYKNFKEVVLAVKKLNGFNLIVAGGGELGEQDSKFLEQHIPNQYTFYKDLTTAQLVDLYKMSFCLVYPSSYEGFGLPMLEAMAVGCPVIACDNSCIKEVTGGAALLINDHSTENIVNAIYEMENFKIRENLIAEGKIQANKFTWEKTIEDTLNLYKKYSNFK